MCKKYARIYKKTTFFKQPIMYSKTGFDFICSVKIVPNSRVSRSKGYSCNALNTFVSTLHKQKHCLRSSNQNFVFRAFTSSKNVTFQFCKVDAYNLTTKLKKNCCNNGSPSRITTIAFASEIPLSGEIFKENFTDIFYTDFEQVAFSKPFLVPFSDSSALQMQKCKSNQSSGFDFLQTVNDDFINKSSYKLKASYKSLICSCKKLSACKRGRFAPYKSLICKGHVQIKDVAPTNRRFDQEHKIKDLNVLLVKPSACRSNIEYLLLPEKTLNQEFVRALLLQTEGLTRSTTLKLCKQSKVCKKFVNKCFYQYKLKLKYKSSYNLTRNVTSTSWCKSTYNYESTYKSLICTCKKLCPLSNLRFEKARALPSQSFALPLISTCKESYKSYGKESYLANKIRDKSPSSSSKSLFSKKTAFNPSTNLRFVKMTTISLNVKIGDYFSSGDIVGEKRSGITLPLQLSDSVENLTRSKMHHPESQRLTICGKHKTPSTICRVDCLSRFSKKNKQNNKTPIILNVSGRVVGISKTQLIIQKTQPILFYDSATIHVKKGEWVKEGSPILTLTHQTLITGDIVQGIPRIEQLFEAFSSAPPGIKDKKAFLKEKAVHDTLHSRVRDIFRKNWLQFVLPIAVRRTLEEIQSILVEMIQKVYLSQGVLIADKHIEIIIRQMTSKGQILDSGMTGLFLEEVLPIQQIENANITTPGKKCLYVPAVVGLTAAALTCDSFISAASFQETTRVLSRDAVVGKSDFLRGLKEKVVIGDLISAGTGMDIYFVYHLFSQSL